MSAVVNPTNMNVADANAAANGVTAFKVSLGTASGGPYTGPVATVPVASMTNNGSVYTVPMAQVTWNPALTNGVTYFGVAEAVNAGGASPPSPEASFQMVSLPTAPTALSFT
jgi:hypothetical protein